MIKKLHRLYGLMESNMYLALCKPPLATFGAQNKPIQTFSIILPNLIHKSRRKNLKI